MTTMSARGGIALSALLMLAFLGPGLAFIIPERRNTPVEAYDPNDPFDPSNMVNARFASVATDSPQCSEVGTNILARSGGSVVDAAIASLLCTGIFNRHSMGIGGGFFMTIYATPNNGTEKEMVTLLAREKAPLSFHRDTFTDGAADSLTGGMAIGTPGEISGYKAAWERFGKIPWRDLFTPTIKMLKEGYPVSKALADAIVQEEAAIRAHKSLNDILTNWDNSLLREGDLAYDLKLARTLERIAEGENFYRGPLANDIIADIADYDGAVTRRDLAIYQPRWATPVTVPIANGGFILNGPPPPSSGAVLFYMMNILNDYNFDENSLNTPDDRILTYHRIMEAFKFGYAKRSALGDDTFVDVSDILRDMTSSEYASSIRSRINDDQTQDVLYYEPAYEGYTDQGTTHIAALGADGSAVSVTSTINWSFGSKVRGRRTGILFNNEMDDFSVPGTVNAWGVSASPSNYIEPLKMPMSSMSPTIVTNNDGEVVFVGGGSGGTRITTSVAYVMIHNLWFGQPLNEATDVPRLHHQLLPHYVEHESHVDEELLQGLQAKGHDLQIRNKYMAIVQSIRNACIDYPEDTRPKYCIHGVSDGRKGGSPDGY